MEEKKHIQAFINNISFPTNLEELYWFITEHGCFNVEDILWDETTEWTAPSWAKKGDIVFFMHGKTVRAKISKLQTELKNSKDKYSNEKYNVMRDWLYRGKELYNLYGGKIFAIAIITDSPEYIIDEELEEDIALHWSSRIYAKMDIIKLLENPVDSLEFNDFITISRQGAITPVVGNDFTELIKRISKNNRLPREILECDAMPMPLSKINFENWFEVSNEYRRSFLLEIQFRRYYVDYLLKTIGDIKTIYRECTCKRKNYKDSFADNVIKIGSKYLPVEVKLSITSQKNIKAQVEKYCNDDCIVIDNKKDRRIYPEQIYNNFVLIVDTDCIYLYDNRKNSIDVIQTLDDLESVQELFFVRKKILSKIK